MIIGVVADTHMPRRGKRFPTALVAGLDGVDMIIHAGDITEGWVLEELSKLAPVTAVAGNVDSPEVAEANGYRKTLDIQGKTIGVFHGHGSGGKTVERAYSAFSGADCIVFGHSHIPYCRRHGDVLMFNPGSPTDKRRQPQYSYGLLFVEDIITGKIIYFT